MLTRAFRLPPFAGIHRPPTKVDMEIAMTIRTARRSAIVDAQQQIVAEAQREREGDVGAGDADRQIAVEGRLRRSAPAPASLLSCLSSCGRFSCRTSDTEG